MLPKEVGWFVLTTGVQPNETDGISKVLLYNNNNENNSKVSNRDRTNSNRNIYNVTDLEAGTTIIPVKITVKANAITE